MLEAAAAFGSGPVWRTKSLTEEDLEELKGCLDLDFGFAYHEIPELCETLPALDLCYSMNGGFLTRRSGELDHRGHDRGPAIQIFVRPCCIACCWPLITCGSVSC